MSKATDKKKKVSHVILFFVCFGFKKKKRCSTTTLLIFFTNEKKKRGSQPIGDVLAEFVYQKGHTRLNHSPVLSVIVFTPVGSWWWPFAWRDTVNQRRPGIK
jgi:hypothetical protein